MTKPRHEPGCKLAGKGLLISFQKGLLRLNSTLNMCRLQSPTLQMEIMRSAVQQAFTPPKHVEPVTASLPGGAVPDRATTWGPAGSSLKTVIEPDEEPSPVGAKRMGTA